MDYNKIKIILKRRIVISLIEIFLTILGIYFILEMKAIMTFVVFSINFIFLDYKMYYYSKK